MLPERWAALAYIAEHPGAQTREISDAIRLESKTTIRRLHDLKALGWLDNTSAGENNAWAWVLTPAGKAAWFSVQGEGRAPSFTIPGQHVGLDKGLDRPSRAAEIRDPVSNRIVQVESFQNADSVLENGSSKGLDNFVLLGGRGEKEESVGRGNTPVQPDSASHLVKEPYDVNFPQKAVNSGMTFGELARLSDQDLETQETEGGE